MAGYIRQSSFVDGDTITAAIFNNEYNQLVNAFNNATGHAHDGTAAEGPVIGLIGDAGETSPNNKVLIDTTNNYIEFYVEVSSAPVQQLYISDGAIIPVTDSDVDLGTSSLYFKDTYTDTVTTTGNVTVGGDLTVTGSATISGNLTFGDADTDSINLAAEIDSDIIPNTDGTYDLGSATKEWQDLYIDGTANIDSLVADTADINGGTIDGATIATSDITVGAGKTLDVSAGTLTLADDQISGDKVEGGTIAATTITTLGSTTGNITNVNATTVDTTNIEVTNLKAKDGTAAGSIADSTGVVTLASSVLTTTDINGGTIDGSTIATSDITVGAAKTLDVSAGTLTLADNQISGDKVEGGTINATTINTLTFGSLNDGTITATAFVDEDDMTSDSATLIPTQQSVKAYVDSQVTAQDLDFQGDTGGALSIDLDSETLTIAGGTGLDTVGSGNTVTVNIDSTVATLTGTQTLTNKTLTSPVINTGVSGTAVLDDDTFATATATTLATSESIKAYVDTTVAATNEVVEDTTPQLGGDLDLNSYDITGTGNINITGTIQSSGNITGTLATAAQPNITSLGSLTALDVTGTATMDGLTVDGGGTNIGIVTKSTDQFAFIGFEDNTSSTSSVYIGADGNDFIARANSITRFRAASNGDISFYEDTGTTAKLFWDASTENLGIGTTGAVTKKLELVSDTSETAQLIVSSDTGTSALYFGSTSDTIKGGIRLDNSDNSLQFTGYNNTERLRIDSSGNVGIGTTAPSTKLNVRGADLTSTTDKREILLEAHSNNTDNSQGALTGITFRNNPTSYTAGSFSKTSGVYGLNEDDGFGGIYGRAMGLAFYTSTVDATALERVRIDASGNVGIGTTSPDAALTLNGSSSSRLNMRAGNTRYGTLFADSGVFAVSSIGSIPLVMGTNDIEAMRIDSSGNVGIGTSSPTAGVKLHVTNATQVNQYLESTGNATNSILQTGADGNSAYVFNRANAGLTFGTNNTERMRINSAGSVGIGTTSPNQDGFGTESTVLTVKAPTSGGTGALELIGLANTSGDLMSAINFMSYAVASPAARITAIRHTSDTAASIAFDTSGGERLRIDKSGGILAGTTSNAAANKTGQVVAASGIITTQAAITTTNGTVDVTVPAGGIMIVAQSGYSADAAIFTFKASGGSQGIYGTGIGNTSWAFGTTSEPGGLERNKVWVQTTNTLRFKDNGYGARTYQLTILSNTA
jgi:hypothetical protein